jgi:hypothetical protein
MLMTGRRQQSATWLPELEAIGTDVLIVCGEDEARPIRHGASPRLLNRLERGGRFRLAYLPELEHGLLIARQRAEVQDLITDHIRRRFGTGPLEPIARAADHSNGPPSPTDIAAGQADGKASVGRQ